MMQHTPGPWTFDGFNGTAGVYTVSASGRGVASCGGPPDNPEAEANGRLIAASPELRDALKASVMNHCPEDRWSGLSCSTCTPARALLARIDAAPTS